MTRNASMKQQAAVTAIAGVVLSAASGFTSAATQQDVKRISIRMGDRTVSATLNDTDAARDLAAMLPLSIHMRDHMRREKTGPIPKPLSERAQGSPTYEKGDLGYWRPGGNFVIFYRHDGLTIPPPGIVLLGKIDSGTEVFDVPGSVDITVEPIK